MRRILIALILLLSLALPLLLDQVPTAMAANLYPPNGTLGSKTIQSLAMPGEARTVTDPTFGNNVERVSDMTTFGTTNTELRHDYALISVWNADSTLAFLTGWGQFNTGYLLDGKTGQYLRTVHEPEGDHTARWSNVNPDLMYGVPPGTGCNNGNQLAVWHPETDTASTPTVTVIHTFSQFDACGNMNFGEDKGNLSNNDTLGAVIGWSTTQNSWGIVSFSMSNISSGTPTVTEIATHWFGTSGGPSGPDNETFNVTAAPKSDGLIVSWNQSGPGPNQGTDWYSKDFTVSHHITDSNSHQNVGLDVHGNEALIASCSQSGGNSTNTCTGVTQPAAGTHITLYGLGASGPTGSNLVIMPYEAGLSTSIHISCRNLNRPGWCYVSDMANDPTLPIGYEQIHAIKLDGSQTVEVFGVDHGSQNTCANCNQYAATAVPSPDGSKVIFTSDWGAGSTSPAYDYIAQWPQNSHYQKINNVFIIMMENHDWSAIKGASDAPYINSLLSRSDASYAGNYHNVLSTEAGGNLHPSEPNYIWTEAATNAFTDHTFTTDNDATSGNYTTSNQHLTYNLTHADLSRKMWTGYMESKPAGVCPITSSGQYAAKHDPFVFFADVAGNPPSSTNSNCQYFVRDTSQLATDATNKTFTPYSYIVPNLCNDMHDSCSPTNDPVKQGDNWLSSNLPTILNSAQYQSGGAVFITWDEDSSSSNNAVGMIVLSPFARGNGYTNSIAYSHTSLVKTIENIFGLAYVGNSRNSTPPDLVDLFK